MNSKDTDALIEWAVQELTTKQRHLIYSPCLVVNSSESHNHRDNAFTGPEWIRSKPEGTEESKEGGIATYLNITTVRLLEGHHSRAHETIAAAVYQVEKAHINNKREKKFVVAPKEVNDKKAKQERNPLVLTFLFNVCPSGSSVLAI